MKKKLFSLTILIFLFSNWFTFLNAADYWSNVPDGPATAEEAISSKLEGRKLDPIEGIWFSEGLGTTVIFKEKGIFKLYIIDIDYEGDEVFNRTWEATFIKRSSYYDFFTRVWYSQSDGSYKLKTQTGTTEVFSSSNSMFMDYDNLSDQGRQMDHTMFRVWPKNLTAYNKKFETKKDKTKTEKYKPYKKTNYKDYWWVLVLLALGTFFLYSLTVKKPKKNIRKMKKSKKRSWIARYWAGEESLAFSFWGVSTLGLILLQIPNFVIVAQGDHYMDSISDMAALFYILYLFTLIAAIVIAYVGCWRSAAKYIMMKIRKKQSAVWGYVTYVLISLSVIRILASFIGEFT